jgi:hypothetical protein
LLLLPFLVKALDRLAGLTQIVPRALPALSVLAGAAGASLHLAIAPTRSPEMPSRIAAALAADPRELRVMNDYNIGGFLTGMAGPRERIAIDGRTAIWPERFVTEYVDALSGKGDWRGLVDRLEPNAAVLPRNSDVTRGLIQERGWHIRMREWRWVLVEPDE